jgi:hypothetical protein
MPGVVPAAARPFLGAWTIWLGGYVALLAADLALRRSGLGPEGITAHPLALLVPVTVLGGAAVGFFLAATRRWRLISRLLLVAAQAPFAYLSAVSLGYSYLCLFGDGCP